MAEKHPTKYFKQSAKDLLKKVQAEDASACERVRAIYSDTATKTDKELSGSCVLMRAQHVVAVEHGFKNWAELLKASPADARRAIEKHRTSQQASSSTQTSAQAPSPSQAGTPNRKRRAGSLNSAFTLDAMDGMMSGLRKAMGVTDLGAFANGAAEAVKAMVGPQMDFASMADAAGIVAEQQRWMKDLVPDLSELSGAHLAVKNSALGIVDEMNKTTLNAGATVQQMNEAVKSMVGASAAVTSATEVFEHTNRLQKMFEPPSSMKALMDLERQLKGLI